MMSLKRKSVTIHQPNFLPWIGYFEKIDMVDLFIILDDVQYKKNDFINRNRIRQKNSIIWLTVPVHFHFPEEINKVLIAENEEWIEKITKTINLLYRGRPFFNDYFPEFESIMLGKWKFLCDLNIELINWFCRCLEIKTEFAKASKFNIKEQKTERLLKLLEATQATDYFCGQGARNYLKKERFDAIKLHWQEFKHPVYDQGLTPFISHLSAVDILFNHGRESMNIIRSGRDWSENEQE
ncbi:MAG: WbqC family protein [Candidatus Coatesbacteria bacterium]|nr:WbqC family protein [Candidatus Coatesbacteria bacterium]